MEEITHVPWSHPRLSSQTVQTSLPERLWKQPTAFRIWPSLRRQYTFRSFSSDRRDVLHPDTLSRPFAERNHVLLEVFSGLQVQPSFRHEAMRIWKDGFIMMHKHTGHFNWGLLSVGSCPWKFQMSTLTPGGMVHSL